MISILNSILDFFKAEKTVYSHRKRTLEKIALEKGIDIHLINDEAKATLESEGRTVAIMQIRKRFHVPLATAWNFVDKLK